MPDKDGYELLKMLTGTKPLILVTLLTVIASENALQWDRLLLPFSAR